MTQSRLATVAACLILATSFGCRQVDRQQALDPWEGDDLPALLVAPQAISNKTESSASSAGVKAAAAAMPESPVTNRNTFELPEPRRPDIQFELLDTPPPADSALASLPPTEDDFLATLSPGARRFYDGEDNCYGEEPTRFAIFRHLCREDLGCGWQRIKQDYRNYYSWNSLGMLGVGIGLGAIAANTNIDYDIRDDYQDDVRDGTGDDFARWAKVFGEGQYVIAGAAAAWLAGEALYDRPAGDVVGEWGGRTMRSLFVGVPPMLLMQSVTGGPRPGESHAGSKWRPFHDNNGVSGHSFMGSTPFINAAKMSDNLALKLGFYACSFAPGWSRVNDDAHFTSQVFLGWWMAYWAATAVDLTNRNEHSQWSVQTISIGDGSGAALVFSY